MGVSDLSESWPAGKCRVKFWGDSRGIWRRHLPKGQDSDKSLTPMIKTYYATPRLFYSIWSACFARLSGTASHHFVVYDLLGCSSNFPPNPDQSFNVNYLINKSINVLIMVKSNFYLVNHSIFNAESNNNYLHHTFLSINRT